MRERLLDRLGRRVPVYYEVADRRLRLRGTNPEFWRCLGDTCPDGEVALTDAFPELVGYEESLTGLLAMGEGVLTIPELCRGPPGRREPLWFNLSVLMDADLGDGPVVVVEDITAQSAGQQAALQSRNEIALLKDRLLRRTEGLRSTARKLAASRRLVAAQNAELKRLNDEVRRYSHNLEGQVRARTRELVSSRLEVIHRLAQASEFRNRETGEHITRMSRYSVLLARSVGVPESDCDLLYQATPLHDIGKIAIPDSILLKAGPLTPEERTAMMQHTTTGHRLLAGSESDLMTAAAIIARGHHEHWDGSGYPDGLAGEAIPLFARICAIADVYDALTSSRPYKEEWPPERARDEIRRDSGRAFDPRLVQGFLAAGEDFERIRLQFAAGGGDVQVLAGE